jgi:hypothetical protein
LVDVVVVVLYQLLVLVEMIEKMLMILMMNNKMSSNPYLALLFLSEEKTQSESRIITYVLFSVVGISMKRKKNFKEKKNTAERMHSQACCKMRR